MVYMFVNSPRHLKICQYLNLSQDKIIIYKTQIHVTLRNKMDLDQFETYDKAWYALQQSSLKKIQTAQFGEIQIYEQGMFTKKKLLFIGDVFKPLASYAPLFKALYEDFYIMSYDLYGQGNSNRDPNDEYTFNVFVDQFRVVLTHFGIQGTDIHIVAQGFGCTILAGYLNYQRNNAMQELNIISVTLISPTGICPKLMQTFNRAKKVKKPKFSCLAGCSNPDDINKRVEQYNLDLYRKSYQYFSPEQKGCFAYKFDNPVKDVLFFEYIWQNNIIVQPELYQAFQCLPYSLCNRVIVLEQDEYNQDEELVQFFADNLPDFKLVEMDRSRSEVASLEPKRLSKLLLTDIIQENDFHVMHTVSLDLK